MSTLSKSEFDSIVHSAAGEMPQILKASIDGFKVNVTFASHSGKTKWNSILDFDEVTGNYTHTAMYLGISINLPLLFGDRISSRIKERLNH